MNYALGLYEKAMPAGLSWEEMLLAAKHAGFDYLEMSIDETAERQSRLKWSEAERLRLITTMMDTQMPIRSICLSAHRKYPLGSHDSAIRAHGMEIMRDAIRLADNLGVRLIQLAGYDVYYETGDEETRTYFLENLRLATEFAAANGVIMGFETMETPFMDTISKGLYYTRKVQSPYLGMYPDLGNLTNAARLYDLSVPEEIQNAKGSLFAMHLKETVEGKYRDMDFGTGKVDFVSGIRLALASDVRMFVAEFWHDGKDGWQNRLTQTNRFLRDQFEQANAGEL